MTKNIGTGGGSMEGLNRKEVKLLRELLAKAGGKAPRNIVRRMTAKEIKRLEGKLAAAGAEPVIVRFARVRTMIMTMAEWNEWTLASKEHGKRLKAEGRGIFEGAGAHEAA